MPALAMKNVTHGLRMLGDTVFSGAARRGPSEFDLARGTDTDAIREVGSLRIESDNARYAQRYQPSPVARVERIIASLPIRHDDFAFIDFGAGKGRVLLIAAEFPFARVCGVEFAAELCDVAAKNIARIPPEKRRANVVECVHADAALYPVPPRPLVCYFYNPFDREIMQRVVGGLNDSLARLPRDAFVVYVQPEHRTLLDQDVRWRPIETADSHVIYRARLPEAYSSRAPASA